MKNKIKKYLHFNIPYWTTNQPNEEKRQQLKKKRKIKWKIKLIHKKK
jgi:hypothetical protein